MFETMVRDMPHWARAGLDSSRGSTLTAPFSMATEISSGTVKRSSPFGPLALTVWPSRLAVTPCGTATGFLPIRDILLSSGSEHRADHFAAHIGLAGVVVGHDAAGGGDDRHAEPIVDARQVLGRDIDAAAGLRHA